MHGRIGNCRQQNNSTQVGKCQSAYIRQAGAAPGAHGSAPNEAVTDAIPTTPAPLTDLRQPVRGAGAVQAAFIIALPEALPRFAQKQHLHATCATLCFMNITIGAPWLVIKNTSSRPAIKWGGVIPCSRCSASAPLGEKSCPGYVGFFRYDTSPYKTLRLASPLARTTPEYSRVVKFYGEPMLVALGLPVSGCPASGAIGHAASTPPIQPTIQALQSRERSPGIMSADCNCSDCQFISARLLGPIDCPTSTDKTPAN